MNKINGLNDFLDFDYNPDYWYDQLRGEAAEQILALSKDEFNQLLHRSQDFSVRAQTHLAEALLLVENPKAIQMLLSLLNSSSSIVGGAVANTIIEKGYSWSPSKSELKNLNRHLNNASHRDRYSLELLISRLPSFDID